MARRTKVYVVESEGRDKGKHFLLTEMSAAQGEDWAARVLTGMAQGGAEVPANVLAAGMQGIASFGLLSVLKMPIEMARPLLAEMMACVQIIPDPSRPQVARPLVDDDIEEISTRFKLRQEVFELIAGFSIADVVLQLMAMPAPAVENASLNTRTSRKQSRR